MQTSEENGNSSQKSVNGARIRNKGNRLKTDSGLYLDLNLDRLKKFNDF